MSSMEVSTNQASCGRVGLHHVTVLDPVFRICLPILHRAIPPRDPHRTHSGKIKDREMISIINAQPSALSSKTLHSQHTRALPTRSRQPHRCFDHQPATVRRFVPCRGHVTELRPPDQRFRCMSLIISVCLTL